MLKLYHRHMKWWLSARDAPDWAVTIFTAPITAAVISGLAVALGLISSLWTSDIKSSMAAMVNLQFTWHCIFWLALAVWGLAFYSHLVIQSEQGKRVERMLMRAPNPRILSSYKETYEGLQRALHLRDLFGSNEEQMALLEDRLRSSLAMIASFAKGFANANTVVEYRVNLMLVTDAQAPSKMIVDVLRFVGDSGLMGLDAILYVPTALYTGTNGKRLTLPGSVALALPVPSRVRNDDGFALALPGAPTAFLEGRASIYEDARRMAQDYCGDFHASVRKEVEDYFAPGGNGGSVRSFASFRIDNTDDQGRGGGVSVMNIDSDSTFVLGKDREYYVTFDALMAPILPLFAPLIVRYATLTKLGGTNIVARATA